MAINCDNNNAYAAEQAALDDRLMDKFPENTSAAATDAINADLTQYSALGAGLKTRGLGRWTPCSTFSKVAGAASSTSIRRRASRPDPASST
ncbi:MAG: hypothetical protein JOZ65_23765 [Chloroflexi bacterium]|nr:hypothetical protein [Chloroflexota bacterium]